MIVWYPRLRRFASFRKLVERSRRQPRRGAETSSLRPRGARLRGDSHGGRNIGEAQAGCRPVNPLVSHRAQCSAPLESSARHPEPFEVTRRATIDGNKRPARLPRTPTPDERRCCRRSEAPCRWQSHDVPWRARVLQRPPRALGRYLAVATQARHTILR